MGIRFPQVNFGQHKVRYTPEPETARSIIMCSIFCSHILAPCFLTVCPLVITSTPPLPPRRQLARLSGCLLTCLPGLWQVTATSRLSKPPPLPAAVATKLQQTLASATALAESLMQRYCQEVGELVGLMEEVPPLQLVTTRMVEVCGRGECFGW